MDSNDPHPPAYAEDMLREGMPPYTVESPSKIRLGPEAKYWAKEFGMTLEQYAQHLLAQQRQRETGNSQ